MKKLIAFIGLFAMVLVCMPCTVASASEFDLNSYKSIADDYVVSKSKFDLSAYPYYVIQGLSNGDLDYARIVYSKVPLSYCTKYLNVVQNKYVGSFHPSTSVDNGTSYIHAKEDDTQLVIVRSTGTHSFLTSTYDLCFKDNSDGITFYGIDYNHDIYNFETGDLVFRLPPVRTELATILEESNRRTTPIIQVIYLLPLAISLVVSFLALRKCLTMLSRLLHQS